MGWRFACTKSPDFLHKLHITPRIRRQRHNHLVALSSSNRTQASIQPNNSQSQVNEFSRQLIGYGSSEDWTVDAQPNAYWHITHACRRTYRGLSTHHFQSDARQPHHQPSGNPHSPPRHPSPIPTNYAPVSIVSPTALRPTIHGMRWQKRATCLSSRCSCYSPPVWCPPSSCYKWQQPTPVHTSLPPMKSQPLSTLSTSPSRRTSLTIGMWPRSSGSRTSCGWESC